MVYDLIIIGAGAAGLFAGASLPSPVRGLIIEKNSKPGRKLLMSGSGQCNLTHNGNIKDFIPHYGKNGSQIRSLLYHFSNRSVVSFFEKQGISLFEREDGKVFPQSLQAQDVLDALVKCCINNGVEFLYSSPIIQIDYKDHLYSIDTNHGTYSAKKLIIATGGCSYPSTGSDGSLFPLLQNMGIRLEQTRPALVPIHVQDYPYQELSGISFQNSRVTIRRKSTEEPIYKSKNSKEELTDALLLTHTCFSGPAVLNLSRYASTGDQLIINYIPEQDPVMIGKEIFETLQGSKRQLISVLSEHPAFSELPKRFLEVVCQRCGIDHTMKASQISGAGIKAILKMLAGDTFSISGLGGYSIAMVTSGGVSLSEVNVKTMESVQYPNLYFAGEVLDIDGDTGGYNLQFAFSSANLAATQSK